MNSAPDSSVGSWRSSRSGARTSRLAAAPGLTACSPRRLTSTVVTGRYFRGAHLLTEPTEVLRGELAVSPGAACRAASSGRLAAQHRFKSTAPGATTHQVLAERSGPSPSNSGPAPGCSASFTGRRLGTYRGPSAPARAASLQSPRNAAAMHAGYFRLGLQVPPALGPRGARQPPDPAAPSSRQHLGLQPPRSRPRQERGRRASNATSPDVAPYVGRYAAPPACSLPRPRRAGSARPRGQGGHVAPEAAYAPACRQCRARAAARWALTSWREQASRRRGATHARVEAAFRLAAGARWPRPGSNFTRRSAAPPSRRRVANSENFDLGRPNLTTHHERAATNSISCSAKMREAPDRSRDPRLAREGGDAGYAASRFDSCCESE